MMQRLVTRAMVQQRLSGLLRPGMDVMVHSSLSGLGYLPNGADDVIDAVLGLIGRQGTMLVPSHSGQLTDPAEWKSPAVPAEWVRTIRAEMDPVCRTTPARNRGLLVDRFMVRYDALRSTHPIASVAALGARSGYYTDGHPLHESEGEGSPLHRLYLADGYALLLGVGIEVCASLHVAEYLADAPWLWEGTPAVCVAKGQFVRLARYPQAVPADAADVVENASAVIRTDFEGYPIALVALQPAIDALIGHYTVKLDRDAA